jgi:hypothetical protein
MVARENRPKGVALPGGSTFEVITRRRHVRWAGAGMTCAPAGRAASPAAPPVPIAPVPAASPIPVSPVDPPDPEAPPLPPEALPVQSKLRSAPHPY